MSLFQALTADQKKILDQLLSEIQKQKLLSEIQKLMFDRSHFVRFLIANNFDVKQTLTHFSEYLVWRKNQNIDRLSELEFAQYDSIKEFFPNGFHETDKYGKPLFIVQIGQTKVKELLEIASAETLIHFMLKEVEHTWRTKFTECQQLVFKEGVEQLVLVVDMKGAKLKDLSNKQMNVIFRSLLIEFQRYYPEMLDQCFIVNTPMFFESFWDSEIKPHLSPKTISRVIITGESSHKDLQARFDQTKLPQLYGGVCECEATCVYSDKGPWADIENKINYQNKQVTEMGGTGAQVEEFKFQEDDDDQIDLLNDRGLADLKNAIQMNMPIDFDGDDLSKIKNNTIIGGGECDINQEDLLRSMLSKQIINLPGATPMNTQMDDDKD